MADTAAFLRANPAWIALIICIISCFGCVIWSARRELAGLSSFDGQVWFQRFLGLGIISILAIITTGVNQ